MPSVSADAASDSVSAGRGSSLVIRGTQECRPTWPTPDHRSASLWVAHGDAGEVGAWLGFYVDDRKRLDKIYARACKVIENQTGE
jgi:hypothetical protein